MKFIIDKIEDNFISVELENKKFINIPKEIVPVNAKEGDVISVVIDEEETNNRRKIISDLMTKLWED